MKAETQPNPTPAPSTNAAAPAAPAAPTTFTKPHTGVTRYNPDFALLILERIATTPESLARICSAPDMPGVATIFRWCREHPEFRELYHDAKQAQAEIAVEEARQLVDDTSIDDPDRDHMKRCHMRVEFRKWIAAKLLPRNHHGDKVESVPATPKHRAGTEIEPGNSNGNDNEEQFTMTEALRLQLIEHRRLMTENGADGGE